MLQSCHLCGFIMLKGNVLGVHVVWYSLFTLRKKAKMRFGDCGGVPCMYVEMSNDGMQSHG